MNQRFRGLPFVKSPKPVILGLGNLLLRDEGLGIHIVQRLMREDIAEYTELVDGGTDALSLLGIVEAADRLLIIDAINTGSPPGTIRLIQSQEIPLILTSSMSPHQIGFSEVLTLAKLRGRLPAHSLLVGIEPQSLDWGTELTPLLAQRVPEIVGLVYQQINDWVFK